MALTLEVIVPTHGRSAGAIRAINSVLRCSDHRVGIRCHSNGEDKRLAEYCRSDERVSYGSFENNRGSAENFYKLYQDTQAEFCMLLSDEDSVVPQQLPHLLDFLDQVPIHCQVVGCSVWEEDQQRWYRKYVDSKYAQALNLAGFTLNHADTYMSGYIFRVEQLKSLDLRTLCGLPGPAHCRNVYGHVDIAQRLLTEGSFLTYGENLVVKGEQISEGGHAFSHRASGESATEDNLDLNPEVYGPYARTCQYFYREFLLQGLKPYFSPLAFIAAEATLFLFFYQATAQSSNVVRIETDRSIGTEAARAIEDSLAAGFISGSTNSHLFMDSVRGSGEGALAGAALMQGILKSLLEKPMMEQMRY